MPAERIRPKPRGLAGGRTWIDPYGWLERLEPDELRGLLRAEDHAAATVLAAQAELAAQLCAEFDGRADRALRWHGSGRYQVAVGPDTATSLTIHRRDRDGDGPPRQVQVPHGGVAGVVVGALAVSRTGLAAVPVDQDGSERYRIVLVDFDTHTARWLPEVTCTGPVVWNRRGTALYLVEPAEGGPDGLVRVATGTGRRRVLRRVSEEDMLATVAGTVSGAYVRYEEYSAAVSRTVLIADDTDDTDDADNTDDTDPHGAAGTEPAVVELAPALDGDDYSIDHVAGAVVRLDYRAGRFLLTVTAEPDQDGPPCWVSAQDEEVSDFAAHPGAVLLLTLRAGQTSLVVVPTVAPAGTADAGCAPVRRIVVGDLEHVDLGTGERRRAATAELLHQSFLTPPRPLRLPLRGDRRVGTEGAGNRGTQVDGLVGGLVGAGTSHEAGPYRARRFAARVRDGADVPVTLLGPGDRLTDPDAPLLLFAYGAYGESVHALYTPFRMSLFDRGIRMAVLHVRGGGELGEGWHAAAVAEHKPTSIQDFDDCVGWLIDQGLARPGALLARGRSAGAFTVCGAVNLRPAAYRAVVLEFPFVDPLGGLTDPAAPHLAQDFEEWGDPSRDTAVADALLAHAPLRTLPGADFPPSLLYSAWHDQHVQPWQALKLSWAINDGAAPRAAPLLRLLEDEGHAGPRSAAADAAYEAELLAFLIHAAHATEPVAEPATEPPAPTKSGAYRHGRAVRT